MANNLSGFLRGFFGGATSTIVARREAEQEKDLKNAQNIADMNRTLVQGRNQLDQQELQNKGALDRVRLEKQLEQQNKESQLAMTQRYIDAIRGTGQDIPTPSQGATPTITPEDPTQSMPLSPPGASVDQLLDQAVPSPMTEGSNAAGGTTQKVPDSIASGITGDTPTSVEDPRTVYRRKQQQYLNSSARLKDVGFDDASQADKTRADMEENKIKDLDTKEKLGLDVVKDFQNSFKKEDVTPFISPDISPIEREITKPLQDSKVNQKIEGKLTAIVRTAMDGNGTILSGQEYHSALTSLLQDKIAIEVKKASGQDTSALEVRYKANLDKFQGMTGMPESNKSKIDSALEDIATKDAITNGTKTKAKDGAIPSVGSEEEYNSLPSGSVFISNGKKYKKP